MTVKDLAPERMSVLSDLRTSENNESSESSQDNSCIVIDSLTFAYEQKKNDKTPLLQNFNLNIEKGKITCIIGRSGCGKSTLLKIMAGLISNWTQGKVSRLLSGRVSMMSHNDCLLPWLSVIDNVLIGFLLRRENTSKQRQKALTLLEQCGLIQLQYKYPQELSQGQKQRVSLVRTLMENTAVVILDEPFSSVDAITRLELQQLVKKMLGNKSVIMTTHDPIEALRLADSLIIMKGRPAVCEELSIAAPTTKNSDNTQLQDFQPMYDYLLKQLNL